MSRSRSPLLVLTGIVLIVAPVVAVVLKCVSFGWMMVFLLFGPMYLFAAGYVVQIIIACQMFFAQRDPLVDQRAAQMRIASAAWLTSVAVVVLAIFLPDGGDSTYGSTFQVWLSESERFPDQASLHAATDTATASVALIATAAWMWGYIWLFVEWIIWRGMRKRARASMAAVPYLPPIYVQPQYAPPPQGAPPRDAAGPGQSIPDAPPQEPDRPER